MPLSPGLRVGACEIVGSLGAGGMGEVYRARDTRLDRDVAIKVLPTALARDPDRLLRFEREAKVLASLNHPNIAQIYGIEESSDGRALVMELVPGGPICGPLPTETAIRYAMQIASALEAAHEKGVVHRDLKPANIFVTPVGVIKVLDFGLAAVNKSNSGVTSGANGETGTAFTPLTQAGVIIGTPTYMSPEQARGKPTDQRTDIWAFGAVLYELFTGQRLFAGETNSDVIAAVLTRELNLAGLPSHVPHGVRAVLKQCLERDLERRSSDIGEVIRQLERTLQGPGETVAAESPSHGPRRSKLMWIGGGIALVALVALTAAYWRQWTGDATATPGSASLAHAVAVLPFVNQSGNPDDEYFSDGMTDELASALVKVPGLRVAARSSAFTFKGKSVDAREVGAKLNVTSVLEGTVRRAGSKLRVTAQLVGVVDGLALWSERYERDAKDVFQVQDDIAAAIVSALRLTLGQKASIGTQGRRPLNAEAHDLQLRGRFLMLKQTEDGLRKSLDYYNQALAKDPDYVPAYTGISYAWTWLADQYEAPRQAYPKAKTAALKALELDPSDSEAHTMLAQVKWFYEWDAQGSEAEFRRALELTPDSVDAHYLYAYSLCGRKRYEEGLALTARAMTLDPLSVMPTWTRELCLSRARRHDEVLAQHKVSAELDPNFFYDDAFAGVAYREKKMWNEAVKEYQRYQEVTGLPSSGLAVTYARMGRTADARKILEQLLAKADRTYVSPDQVAIVYAGLGDMDRAFEWLERAHEARSAWFGTALHSSAYDTLRRDPRFAVLIKKTGIEN
ncbi:MAG TPA: protein kinase [Vicinamibacterales bacterium]|nr:protein kinase [Vicinamibacterales bacterium]